MEYKNESLYECQVNTNEVGDTFVGLKSDGEKIQVCFPLGYQLGTTELEIRKDIQSLIRVLSRFAGIKEKLLPQQLMSNPQTVNFPIQAYLTVLEEYYSRGYYTENEYVYKANSKGPTSWPRTIKTQKPYPQEGSFIYLNTVARETVVDSANLITKINEFCVEESYQKLGWLFTTAKPKKSSIPFDEKRFLMELQTKLMQTNNDKNKALFSGMIDMIRYVGKRGQNAKFFFGTDRFEYVWEKLIDFNFGIGNKSDYFPRTTWYLGDRGAHTKSALEPDTIMLANNKVFILDAKYYKYGASEDPSDLPKSTSINKQITYGEYVATEVKFKDQNGNSPTVYNVFLMPFSKAGRHFHSAHNMVRIGEARGDWKVSGKEYERVQGVLLDVKWMMNRAVKQNSKDISQLAQLVEDVFSATENVDDKSGD